ncbi:MAG: hypothetical protein HEP71_15870 [Roseivirga sp.]|nr:hypothetical protein [Roseivirga sp.]
MKSITYILLVIGILGVAASVFNMIHDWSLSGMGTLFPSAALIGIALFNDQKKAQTTCDKS